MRFADLHCHPHMRTYLWLSRKRERLEEEGKFNPWTIISSNMSRMKHAKRAAGFSQCDMAMLWNSNVRLVFNSLYPIEREFFMGNKTTSKGSRQALKKVMRIATHHKLPIRSLLQSLVMRIPQRTINYIKSPQYKYWESLQDEYNFVISKNREEVTNELFTPSIRKFFESKARRRKRFSNILNANGSYWIPKNQKELKEALDGKKDVITMILTLEGAHALGTDHFEKTEDLIERVNYIKNEWEHPLFFLTFAHHFDNKLCGHASSIPQFGKVLLNQDQFMNEGFSETGKKVIRKLLSLDNNNKPLEEDPYRILIDIKHMSARSRRTYYEEIVNPCLDNGNTIPVIASHCGYSGKKTLQDLIDGLDLENDTDRIKREDGTFYPWSINFCDEDIKMIYKTGGLFGIEFDQRILGVSSNKKEEKVEMLNSIRGIWNNLKAVLNVICNDPSLNMQDKKRAWDILGIGSDFDGYIDPLSSYKTTLDWGQFTVDLLRIIKQDAGGDNPPACVQCFDNDLTPEKAVQKICFGNAYNFVLKHYPNKVPVPLEEAISA